MTATQAKLAIPGKKFRVSDHDLHFLHEPEDRLQAILKLIAAAKKSVRMLFYMFNPDDSGREVLAALIEAASRGLKVALIIDSFGSSDTPRAFFEPLLAAGGQYHCFSSRWGVGYFVRNHQKMLIIDDQHALIGGYNITDQYFGRKADESWEDLGLVITGAEVHRLTTYFDELHQLSSDGSISLKMMRKLTRDWSPGAGKLRWLVGGPTNRMSSWGLSLKQTMQNASQVDIVAAYFSPSQTVLRRIAKVTRQANGSRLVMAAKSDNGATVSAARLLYRYLLKRKAKIFEFQTRPLHSKLFVVDDVVFIGSANLDVRSLFINLEIMLRIEDAAFAKYMREFIDDMVAQSEPQTTALLARRDSYWTRFKSGFAYFLVNTLDYTIGRRIKFGILPKR